NFRYINIARPRQQFCEECTQICSQTRISYYEGLYAKASKLVPSSTSNICTVSDRRYKPVSEYLMGITPPAGRQHETRKIKDLRSDQPSLSSNLRVVAAVMPVKDRTATHGYAERDITHHLSLSIRNGVYTNDAVKGSAHAAVHTYQSNMQGRCMAKFRICKNACFNPCSSQQKYSVKLRERLGELRGIILAISNKFRRVGPPPLAKEFCLSVTSEYAQQGKGYRCKPSFGGGGPHLVGRLHDLNCGLWDLVIWNSRIHPSNFVESLRPHDHV
ncbi:hypothetical protein FocTR4_00006958, partial [Fusarium oxysporum f. sp. cubense]